MSRQPSTALLIALFCALAGLAPAAHAYLDPSTGSMILSAVVGLFATIGLAVKTYWYKLKNFVLRRPARGAQPAAGQPAAAGDRQDAGTPEPGPAKRPS